MDKFRKLVGIIFVTSLAVLPLTGCENPPWESGMTLVLKVDAPRDGATVSTSRSPSTPMSLIRKSASTCALRPRPWPTSSR